MNLYITVLLQKVLKHNLNNTIYICSINIKAKKNNTKLQLHITSPVHKTITPNENSNESFSAKSNYTKH